VIHSAELRIPEKFEVLVDGGDEMLFVVSGGDEVMLVVGGGDFKRL
jgi:hypothetical protein